VVGAVYVRDFFGGEIDSGVDFGEKSEALCLIPEWGCTLGCWRVIGI
jgi:hypothetical protein